jgi:hypothetical protein
MDLRCDNWLRPLEFALRTNRWLSSEQIVESADYQATHVVSLRVLNATRAKALALGLSLTPPACTAVDVISNTITAPVLANIGTFSFISLAQGQPAELTKLQTDAFHAYNSALDHFRSILNERRAQINSHQPLPNLPGQALYLARNDMMSAYKDLTDVLPSRIGRSNKFGIPPAYFDADNEQLFDEYKNLFNIMQAPPINAQNSDTPFKDVVELGTAIGRAKGLDGLNAEVAGRISLGLFFAETNGKQNIGNARSNTYKGSLQTGASEDRNGQRKWAGIKKSIAAFDPELGARDAKEETRVGHLDQRLNHWTAVRNGLANAHADLFPQISAIAKTLPDPIDQMKLFDLIQIIPSPTKAALDSGNLVNFRISDPRIMRYLRNNNIFTFGHVDRAKKSATFREILNAMWLFNGVFERALSKHNEVKAQ